MDYIILHREKNGEYKPLTFKDGVIVIYGDKEEAEKDMYDCDVLFEINEAETDSNKPKFGIGDNVYTLIGNFIYRGSVSSVKVTANKNGIVKLYDVILDCNGMTTTLIEDSLFDSTSSLCKNLVNNIK